MLAVLILLEQEDVLISRVFEVQNGEETISYIKKGSFNIALSDIEINSKQGLNEADISQIMKNSKPINIAKFITTVNNLATQLEEDYRLSNKIVIRNKKK
ncbi:hypothetical protein [Caloranaerobacter azorensis]|uniref:Uncharacterized protein n=1 Tax=Caloranaerobacter azorensis TaxID=116090 RepID=A0A6P1YFD7_9FIRM|nr:hypothetical protein [Caloranaerobacter azorensis]QIB27458.1 hypothetical protein G3A45_09250 [Caloranaerobacter azorensis]